MFFHYCVKHVKRKGPMELSFWLSGSDLYSFLLLIFGVILVVCSLVYRPLVNIGIPWASYNISLIYPYTKVRTFGITCWNWNSVTSNFNLLHTCIFRVSEIKELSSYWSFLLSLCLKAIFILNMNTCISISDVCDLICFVLCVYVWVISNSIFDNIEITL